MRSTHWWMVAGLAAIGALAWIAWGWDPMGARQAGGPAGQVSFADEPQLEPEAIDAEPLATGEGPSEGQRTEALPVEANESVEPSPAPRPRSVRWADYIEVVFDTEGMTPMHGQSRFRPKQVTVFVEGVAEPLNLDDLGKRVRRGTGRYYLTDYYKDEGWLIERVIVEDPRFLPQDVIFDPGVALAEVSLKGSARVEIEVVDAESGEALSDWRAEVRSSASGPEGSVTLQARAQAMRQARVVAARYWIQVSAPEYSIGGLTVDLQPGSQTRVVVPISRTATLSGHVVYQDFSPVPDARVRLAFPGEKGLELPTFGDSFIFGEDNSIPPYYAWPEEVRSEADGSFELQVSASAPMVIEATVGEIRPERVVVEGVAGQPITGVQIVIPNGTRLRGMVQGAPLPLDRGYLIRACGHGGPGEMPGQQWDREVGDSFQVCWIAEDGSFDLGPFSTAGGVKFHVFDAPRSVDPAGWLEDAGVRQLHTEVVKPKDGVLEPVQVKLD